MVGGALVSSYASSKSQSSQQKQQEQNTKEDNELNFQRQAWLAQQQRLWQLQDRKYKQNAIAGFKGQWDTGGDIKPPNQDAEMGQLDQFDPNKLGSIGGPAASPLGQLAPGGGGNGRSLK